MLVTASLLWQHSFTGSCSANKGTELGRRDQLFLFVFPPASSAIMMHFCIPECRKKEDGGGNSSTWVVLTHKKCVLIQREICLHQCSETSDRAQQCWSEWAACWARPAQHQVCAGGRGVCAQNTSASNKLSAVNKQKLQGVAYSCSTLRYIYIK